jgi:threonine dehydrogenase-like Zn-dependent dehydrogenase
LHPDTTVRVRVTERGAPRAEVRGSVWTALVGRVLPAGERVAGFGPPGDEIDVPSWAVAPVPDDLDDDRAALLPLAAVAVRIARLLGARAGEEACVIGADALADLIAAALRARGLPRVAVVPTSPSEVPRVVVETTGEQTVISNLLETAPPSGRIALLGQGLGRTVDVDFYATVHKRGLRVVGAHDFGPLSGIGTAEDRQHDIDAAAALVREIRTT